MKVSTFFGFKCPTCGSKVSMAAGVGENSDKLLCPNCKSEMIPDAEATPSATGVYCPKCDISYGLVTHDKCPKCGGEFKKME